MVKDIYPGVGNSSLGNLTDVNGTLFFTANDGVNGIELWKSDGTAQEPCWSRIYSRVEQFPGNFLTNVGGKLFFSANDGSGRIRIMDQ